MTIFHSDRNSSCLYTSCRIGHLYLRNDECDSQTVSRSEPKYPRVQCRPLRSDHGDNGALVLRGMVKLWLIDITGILKI